MPGPVRTGRGGAVLLWMAAAPRTGNGEGAGPDLLRASAKPRFQLPVAPSFPHCGPPGRGRVLRWPGPRFLRNGRTMSAWTSPSVPPPNVVDLGFVAVRAQLLEVAAFLDRVERHGVADDFRCAALRDAARLLADGRAERARRILEQLSDPTTEPLAHSDGKAAHGAWKGGAR